MESISVFCGSSFGNNSIYEQKAYELGKHLAENNIVLIYGGAKVGLMGALANGALENNGKVIGILPNFLKDKEIAHEGLTQLIWVDSMHERKQKMSELCHGVIALPGGYGTIEEFFEMLTWGQLGLHKKPVALLNINGFFNELISFVDTMVTNGFLKKANQDMLLSDHDIPALISKMLQYKAPAVGKWIIKE
jgi:uncharacterized protein (TIGR00730 family)